MFKRFLLPLNLQQFAEDDNTPPETKVDDKTPADNGKVPEKTFTQAEIDEMIQKRLKREKEKQAELDAKLKRLEEFEKAEEERKTAAMSETERLKAEKEEAAKKAEEAAEKAKKAQESANQRIMNTEIKSIARSLNANDPADVLALLDKANLEIDEEGNVKGVEEAVRALKEAKPWMFKQAIGADASGGSNPAKNPSVNELSAKEKELADIKAQAIKNPRLLGKVTKLYNEILELRNK
ncbi:scaffolding protein [Neobacillus sp. DY30]|uniref:phage scaffolding protein n=1 Tax=Neobacillus sp. DY30 TaxID=3047871 RepID=UPI0024C0934D|nr:scaffolding protein [Neobacillus sp. DY30]WHY01867.1 scaffolding protein [Neobacillus sp. DY30]